MIASITELDGPRKQQLTGVFLWSRIAGFDGEFGYPGPGFGVSNPEAGDSRRATRRLRLLATNSRLGQIMIAQQGTAYSGPLR